MKLYLITLVLFMSSCTITRYYKTKDLRKSYSKYESNLNKSRNNIKQDLDYQRKIVADITRYKLDKSVEKKLRTNLKKCIAIQADMRSANYDFQSRYKKLNLSGKKVRSNESRYGAIEAFNKYLEKQAKRIQKKYDTYSSSRKEFFNILKDNKFTMVKTKEVKKQFDTYNKTFKANYNKTKNLIVTFRKKVSKSRHKNKSKILSELKHLDPILAKINKGNQKVDKLVQKFHKDHAQVKEMVFGPNSPTYQDLEIIKAEANKLNGYAKKFKHHADKIKKLSK